jgi:hypothetical protein
LIDINHSLGSILEIDRPAWMKLHPKPQIIFAVLLVLGFGASMNAQDAFNALPNDNSVSGGGNLPDSETTNQNRVWGSLIPDFRNPLSDESSSRCAPTSIVSEVPT